MDQLNKIFGTLLRKKKTSVRIRSSKQHIRRDWLMLLAGMSLLLIALTLFSANLFIRVNEGSLFVLPEEEGGGIETIDRGLLKDTIDRFEQKRVNFENLKWNAPAIGNL